MTNRQHVLADLRTHLGDSDAERRVTSRQIYCIEDGALLTDLPVWTTAYQHGDHVHDRAFVFDPAMRWEYRPDGELRHFTVAMILWRAGPAERQYCLFRRAAHPIGFYTMPAGHLEIGEVPQEAALREAYEETRLGVINTHRLGGAEELADECLRGANFHVWYVFMGEAIGEATLSHEGDIIGWYTEREILQELPLTSPAGYFFARLFGQTPRSMRPS